MTVRIVSYNLLVPPYADQPEYYFKCQPKFLKIHYRWNLIQAQLEKEIVQNENTILCLQELSLTMLPELQLLFRRLNYSFFYNLYGSRRSDYMGVGIAIPLSMELTSISFIKVGDHIRSMSKRREQQTNFLTWGWNLYEFVRNKFIQPASDPWKTAMDRENTLVCLQIVIDGKPLTVGTYHMPCLFKEPDVMAIHSSVVKDLMFQLATEQDFILAGDFNIKPDDTAYHALTEKDYINVHYPRSNVYDISYQSNSKKILKSAYRENNGSEPVYTNFAHTFNSPPFCATLDYIFFNGQLAVEEVLKLPDHPTGESYPDETHPSDHLMIAATFRQE